YEVLEDPTSCIRLLTLLPSPNYRDVVVCELIAVRLDEAPPYEALSYHWGDGTHNQALIVNGRQKLVTNSLLQALKDLRRPFRPRILWADGLCINQGEDAVEERNMQLFQMQIVFSQASRVVARL
ncbi:heterokaryon incompatibility protein-domain-containing protein, partial [Bisporella sp. PMI_857]